MTDAVSPPPAEPAHVPHISGRALDKGDSASLNSRRPDRPPAETHPGLGRAWVGAILIALALCGVHRLIHPHSVFLQTDAAVMIVAGEALAHDGRPLIPFSRGYSLYPRPFLPIESMESPEWLQDDTRELMVHDPPGMSALTALGIKLGLAPARFLLVTFYIQMFINMIAWQLWSARVGVARLLSLAGLSLFLLFVPTTIPDHYVFALAGVLFLLGQSKPDIWKFSAAAATIALAMLLRQQAIVLAAAWCAWWLMARTDWKTRIQAVVAAGAGTGAAMLIQRLLCGDNNFLESTPRQGFVPTAHQVLDGVYYAFQGGWSPALVPLKGLALAFSLITLVGTLWLAWRRRLAGWHLQVLAVIFINALFLGLMQARYASEFSTAPIRIARYWGFPMFGCICLQGAVLGLLAGSQRQRIVSALYSLFVIACVAQFVYVHERHHAEHFATDEDGFVRHKELSRIHNILREREFLAVFADTNAEVFLSYDPLRIKRSYSPWFRSRTAGEIAFVVTQLISRPQGRLLAEVCRKELKLVEEIPLDNGISIKVFELPAEKVIDARKELAATPGRAKPVARPEKSSRPMRRDD